MHLIEVDVVQLHPAEAVFEVVPPYGVDAIILVASVSPFTDGAILASQWEEEEGDGDPSDSEDFTVAGDYLVQTDIDTTRLEGVVAKGLLVRPMDPERDSSPDGSGVSQIIGSLSAVADVKTTRATCYFTTLPRLY